jgi:hypothetical protein
MRKGRPIGNPGGCRSCKPFGTVMDRYSVRVGADHAYAHCVHFFQRAADIKNASEKTAL